ncbi:hypothetical protein PCYB_002670, partial [Plasmodium cynomolgi strain B]
SYLGSPSRDLLSEKFYDDLNHNTDGSDKYIKHCNSLSSVHKGRIFRIYCAQLLKYLETKYKKPHEHNNEYDDCTLLNYWIIGKLVQFYGSNRDRYFLQAFGKLQLIWSSIIPYDSSTNSNNICKPIFDIYKQDDWYKRKEFYDYCVDYDTVLKTANLYDSQCEAYYKYIESKIPIYEYIKKLCTSESTYACPKFYEECKEFDPKILLSKLNCHSTMQEKRQLLKNY